MARSSVTPVCDRRSRGALTSELLARAAAETEPERSRLHDEVVRLNLVVARTVARRYQGRGEPLDDLEQVAALGLVKAVRGFDPGQGNDFLSYAVPTIRGEVKRHFRDYSWSVRPPRRIQELQPRLSAATYELAAELHRPPTAVELADHLEVERADVVEALSSGGCFNPSSTDEPLGGSHAEHGHGSPLAVIGQVDLGYDLVQARVDLQPAVHQLPSRDRHILRRRVHDDWTQQEIADELGLSQMQVSRRLSAIRRALRAGAEEEVA